ncbi:hypothetical protein EZV62_003913 [Acer yangbiense]|uniref:Uncharacterized protein n=1 Tax=Acer yangbiense TaxID=1000413 RepID=A0A5C7IIL6_9ROSI|nr:hypothetical protein EZV62_003913 [Acer yangbiense]
MDPLNLNPKMVHDGQKTGGTLLQTSRCGFHLHNIVDAIQRYGFNQVNREDKEDREDKEFFLDFSSLQSKPKTPQIEPRTQLETAPEIEPKTAEIEPRTQLESAPEIEPKTTQTLPEIEPKTAAETEPKNIPQTELERQQPDLNPTAPL